MNLIQEYTLSLLLPHLQALALTKPQRAIVIADVSRRLDSLLFHWGDLVFRYTIPILGTEEASFWEPLYRQSGDSFACRCCNQK